MNKYISTFIAINILFLTQTVKASSNDYLEPAYDNISVSFADSSDRFKPGLINQVILERAQDASLIIVNGRTSTNKPSKRDEKLALARAVSARNYLVSHGVSPYKIMLNYVSSGDFISENNTKRGRYINQRVDIKMIYVPTN